MNRSEEVREFYERMPYPAPLISLDEHRALYKNPLRRRAELDRTSPDKHPSDGRKLFDRRLRNLAGGKMCAPRARCVRAGVDDDEDRSLNFVERPWRYD